MRHRVLTAAAALAALLSGSWTTTAWGKGYPPAARPPALLAWVLASGDNEGAPFAVIDKRLARLWLYDAQGRALGQIPVLLGQARGDVSVPGIGERPMAQIRVHERTTPAGRFRVDPGRNADGEDIFWIDYDAAVSMHRVRAGKPVERRLERLATATASDNRISYGCINVPAAFYDGHIQPVFGKQRGVVYVMPERVALQSLFTPAAAKAATASASKATQATAASAVARP